jgi:hypothetical protein
MKMITLWMGRRHDWIEPPDEVRDGMDGLHAWMIPVLKMKVYSPRVDSESDMWVSLEGEMGF